MNRGLVYFHHTPGFLCVAGSCNLLSKSQAINKPMYGMIFVLNSITIERNGLCFRLQLSSATTSNDHGI